MDKEDRKDIDETLDEATMINQDSQSPLPESPASANIKVWISDYGVMFTVRDKKMNKVVERIEFLIEMAKRKGWKPTWSDNGHSKATTVSQATQELGNCKDCGSPNLLSKKGKPYCSKKCWLSGDK